MTERPKLLLDRLSGLVLEILPWNLSVLIGLYLLWGHFSPLAHAERTPVGSLSDPFTPAKFSMGLEHTPPLRPLIRATHDHRFIQACESNIAAAYRNTFVALPYKGTAA